VATHLLGDEAFPFAVDSAPVDIPPKADASYMFLPEKKFKLPSADGNLPLKQSRDNLSIGVHISSYLYSSWPRDSLSRSV
jgi:hypothetical protein